MAFTKALTFATLLSFFLISCSMNPQTNVSSPNENLAVDFSLSDSGQPQYQVSYNGTPIIDPSSLGFEFKNQPALAEGLEIQQTESRSVDKTWQPVWGEQSEVRNHYNELLITLKETSPPIASCICVFVFLTMASVSALNFLNKKVWQTACLL
ncbi:MAG: glycoside hydrolase family 97 N-terminal domain-containing protein [Fodinibius sp.]|nr:glycoside hydrolase family 97 N-terminal domain-containing protein [Fodinibius sp.]